MENAECEKDFLTYSKTFCTEKAGQVNIVTEVVDKDTCHSFADSSDDSSGSGWGSSSGMWGSGDMGSGDMGSGMMGSGDMGSGDMGSGDMGSGMMGSGGWGSGSGSGGDIGEIMATYVLDGKCNHLFDDEGHGFYYKSSAPVTSCIAMGCNAPIGPMVCDEDGATFTSEGSFMDDGEEMTCADAITEVRTYLTCAEIENECKVNKNCEAQQACCKVVERESVTVAISMSFEADPPQSVIDTIEATVVSNLLAELGEGYDVTATMTKDSARRRLLAGVTYTLTIVITGPPGKGDEKPAALNVETLSASAKTAADAGVAAANEELVAAGQSEMVIDVSEPEVEDDGETPSGGGASAGDDSSAGFSVAP